MDAYIAKLEFSSALALGQTELLAGDWPLVRSDTLFSAICHSWAAVYGSGSLEELLRSFDREPPFRLSSMFVYSASTFYLPKPRQAPARAIGSEWAARLRRVRWLPLAEFRSWVRGEPIPWPRLLAAEPQGYARTHAAAARSRMAQDRRGHRAAGFRTLAVEFAEGCGGYFIFQTSSEEVANRVSRCLLWLGETGIGGRRSIGMGQFTVATGGLVPAQPEWDFLSAAEGPAGVLLSLYAPTPQEAGPAGQRGAYVMCERGGWTCAGPSRAAARKPVATMLAEGSVVPLPCSGRLVDAAPAPWRGQPGHAVWRCGVPVVAPCLSLGGQA